MFFNKQENEINFITDFPEIKPDRCLTSNPFIDGDKNYHTTSWISSFIFRSPGFYLS